MKETYLTSSIKTQILKKVNRLLQKYRNSDPFYIARKLGIEYRFITPNNELLAFSERSSNEDLGTIYLNCSLGAYDLKILCAHELGHLLLHRKYNLNLFDKGFDPEKEAEANYFVTLLLPSISLNADIENMSVNELNDFITKKIYLPK